LGQDKQTSGPERAKRWLANARVTASVTANVANPLAGPVADRFDSGPPRSAADVAEQVQEDAQKDWARYERVRRERSAGDVPPAPPGTKRQRDRSH
jgi:hypothetical protein